MTCPELGGRVRRDASGISEEPANTTLQLMYRDMLGRGAMVFLASVFRGRISCIAIIFVPGKLSM